jgi:enoyl-CoA hydratase/carnithine racemase
MVSDGKAEVLITENTAEVIIDHPPANTLSRATLVSLDNILQILNDDESVAAIIISGKGDKFFVGGADINEFHALNPESGKAWIGYWHTVFGKIHHSP